MARSVVISIFATTASRSAAGFCFAMSASSCTAFSGALFIIIMSALSCGILLISVISRLRLVGQKGMAAGLGFTVAIGWAAFLRPE